MRTTFPQEIEGFGSDDTVLTQHSAVFQPEPERDVRFPKRIKHRDAKAVIYGKTKLALITASRGKQMGNVKQQSFSKYGEAKAHADATVRDLAKGSKVTALTPGQARDALAAFERLQSHFQKTGRRVSLLAAVSGFAEADDKLNGRALSEAVEGFLTSIAAVKRKDISEAVEDFITGEEPKTKSQDGQRAQLSAAYAFNRAIQLRRFAATFPGHAVCDLTKAHLDKFIGSLGKIQTKSRNHRAIGSSKTRNGYRAAVRQFLQWSVRKDYLSATHRLFEADTMRPEQTNGGEIAFYTPRELSALLAGADDSLRPLSPLARWLVFAPPKFCGSLGKMSGGSRGTLKFRPARRRLGSVGSLNLSPRSPRGLNRSAPAKAISGRGTKSRSNSISGTVRNG